MRILVSGAGGLVGSALVPELERDGHRVMRLTRGPAVPERAIHWNPEQGALDTVAIEGMDAIVHLAGESIVGRWTPAKKARIRNSRVAGTGLLSAAAAQLSRPPSVFVGASAIGYYGDRGEEPLTERSASGRGFLPDVSQAWEAALQPAAARGIRTVSLRLGIVLSAEGGALAKMLVPFRLGLGGVIGSGRQWWSWVAMEDVTGAIRHALHSGRLRGPANVTAPEPVTNAEFTRVLGRVLRRPTVFPVPAFGARLLMGEMADALLLSSARVAPAALAADGYQFRQPELEPALRSLLS